jgi:5-methylcytosine-specific restriction endonuclease McrA
MAGGRGHRHRELRAALKPDWQARNAACGICGQTTIDWDGEKNEPDSFEMDHILSRKTHPHLEFEPTNQQPSHHHCNRSKNASTQLAGIGVTSEQW